MTGRVPDADNVAIFTKDLIAVISEFSFIGRPDTEKFDRDLLAKTGLTPIFDAIIKSLEFYRPTDDRFGRLIGPALHKPGGTVNIAAKRIQRKKTQYDACHYFHDTSR